MDVKLIQNGDVLFGYIKLPGGFKNVNKNIAVVRHMIIKGEEFLSFEESQRFLEMGRSTIQKAVNQGKISFYRIGRKKMLSKNDLIDFLDTFFVSRRYPKGRPRNTVTINKQ